MNRLLLALTFIGGCHQTQPQAPVVDDTEDTEVHTAVPLPQPTQQRDQRTRPTTSTLVAPPVLDQPDQHERIAHKRVVVDSSGTASSLRRAGITDKLIAELDAATVRRVDLQSQIPPDSVIDVYTRGRVLLGFRADTLIGTVWGVRYDGNVNERGWYDENGRSLRGPLRVRPVDLARVTSGYGMRLHPITGNEKRHTGVDYGTPIGTPVQAIGDGTVRESSTSGTAGNYLKVSHVDGWESWYLHLSDVLVKKGDTIKEGQTIAHTGNTGASTGPHLHFELRIGNIALDPRRTIPVPTSALSPREMPRHAALLAQLKETP